MIVRGQLTLHGAGRALITLLQSIPATLDYLLHKLLVGSYRVRFCHTPRLPQSFRTPPLEPLERIEADLFDLPSELLYNLGKPLELTYGKLLYTDPLLLKRELLRPGRDPRRAFRCVQFRDDVTAVEHIQPGMILEGSVTNVTNFGAFVDIGVHEDGLVHVSQLAHRYVREPNEAVHVGDIVRVKVLSVDTERRRISLSIKQATPPPKRKRRAKKPQQRQDKPPAPKRPKRPPNAPATAEDIARLIAHFESR